MARSSASRCWSAPEPEPDPDDTGIPPLGGTREQYNRTAAQPHPSPRPDHHPTATGCAGWTTIGNETRGRPSTGRPLHFS
jgi:hypothetical protein